MQRLQDDPNFCRKYKEGDIVSPLVDSKFPIEYYLLLKYQGSTPNWRDGTLHGMKEFWDCMDLITGNISRELFLTVEDPVIA